MTGKIFLTGASGFIGSHLVKRLEELPFEAIYCLSRQQNPSPNSTQIGKIRHICGDVADGGTYGQFLSGCEAVIHLAAATGKAEKDVFERVNVFGTKELVARCQSAGVRNFLYVSTIAVKYPDKSRYYYAQSKEQAEVLVANSGLNYTIVRPTIVIGTGSPIWENLARIAKAPVMPYFGDGTTKIQPIHVDDLVSCMVSLIQEGEFSNEVFELGGPEVIAFEQFLREIHTGSTRKRARVIHVPYKPLRAVLSVLEDKFYSKMPVTVGQLSAFNNDGTVQPNRLLSENSSKMMGVKQMINSQISAVPEVSMEVRFNRECQVFTRYLAGQEPTEYVLKKYALAHTNLEVYNGSSSDPYEQFLVRLASKNQVLTRAADAYASFFGKRSLLRRKLILLLAILESTSPYYQQFESPDSSNKLVLILSLGVRGLVFLVALTLGLVLAMPARWYFSRQAKSMAKVGESWAR